MKTLLLRLARSLARELLSRVVAAALKRWRS